MTPTEIIKERCLALQKAILESHPTMPVLLREIHQTLKADPEIVTLLDESDIAIIVNGLKRQTATEIATSALKSKSPKKSITLADL
jgi:hypothetical protein